MKRKVKKYILLIVLVHGIFVGVYSSFYGLALNGKNTETIKINVAKIEEERKFIVRKNETSWINSNKVDRSIMRNGWCGQKYISANITDENTWLPVDEKRTMYVFSAYFVKQRKAAYIIGAKHLHTANLVCQIWYRQVNTSKMVVKERKSQIRLLREGQAKKYTAFIYECALHSPDIMPAYISLSTQACRTPLNLLRVKNASIPEKYTKQFTVCLCPIYFRYGRAYELIEWFELNRILGAQKFVIYNISTAINVDRVLEYYSKRGFAEVVQWRLPMAIPTHPRSKQPTEIHYFGQSAVLNDCLFRSKADSEYIVNIDLDEFIIPHGNLINNWTDIIENMKMKSSVYLFRSTYFRKEWDNILNNLPETEMIAKYKLITLQKFEHERTIFSPRRRSKYIAKTAKVDKVHIHEVPGIKPSDVPVELGLVHHYRNWSNLNDRKDQVRDETVQEKFGSELVKRVAAVWKSLDNVEFDIPWSS